MWDENTLKLGKVLGFYGWGDPQQVRKKEKTPQIRRLRNELSLLSVVSLIHQTFCIWVHTVCSIIWNITCMFLMILRSGTRLIFTCLFVIVITFLICQKFHPPNQLLGCVISLKIIHRMCNI